MKKILLVTAAVTLFAGAAIADTFGRNLDNVGANVAASHNFTTNANVVNATVGAAYTLAVIDTKLYVSTGYEVVGETFNGVTVGATYNFSDNAYVDGYVNHNSGVNVATVEVGFNF
jgi:hypothetical protein